MSNSAQLIFPHEFLNNIHDGIIVTDENDRVVFVNSAAIMLLGLSADTIQTELQASIFSIGNKTYSLKSLPLTHGSALGHIKTGLVGGEKFIIITLSEEMGNAEKYKIYVLFDESLDQKLEEMKLDFVTLAAHELRTPLTSIRGYLSLISEQYTDPNSKKDQEVKSILDHAGSGVDRLSALIENLLSVSNIEKGSVKIVKKPEEWGQLLENNIELFRNRASIKNQKIIFEKRKEQVAVSVDALRIGVVITNLLTNAINFTPNGGIITIEYHKKADTILTSIKDTGIGIPHDAQTHLFEKFYRIGGKLEGGDRGTGLGLFITKSILHMHNGKIWVKSTPGKGATFFFTIPIS